MNKSSPQQKRRGSSKPNSRPTKHRAAVPVRAGKLAGKARTQTKQEVLIAMMQKPSGATLAEMCTKTSWQPHSIRAALTGLRKRGLAVTRHKNNAGVTVYRIPAG